jgi:hypothetical protein
MALPTNRTLTLYASAARTATPSPHADKKARGAKGLLVFINVSLVPGSAPSVVFTVQGKDPISGTYYTILASAAITGTGLTVLRVFPGGPVTANLAANDTLPEDWRVTATHGNANSLTYTVGAQYLE